METAGLYRRARDRGVPIMSIDSTDQNATEEYVAFWETERKESGAVYAWDAIRGVRALTEDTPAIGEPGGMLLDAMAAWSVPNSTLIVHGWNDVHASSWLHAQAVCNYRDAWKSSGRTIVLCSPHVTLPDTLDMHNIRLSLDMPDVATICSVVSQLCQDAGRSLPDDGTLSRIIDANRGLDRFAAEQNIALGMANGRTWDIDQMWRTKKSQIDELPGVTLYHRGAGFPDVAGYAPLKEDMSQLFSGPARPGIVVWLDELDKSFTGLGKDTSGVTDQLMQALLTEWSERNWDGVMFLGPRGTGKSEMAKAVGIQFDVPVIAASIPEMQGGLVGQSNTNLRRFFSAIHGMSDGRVLCIATGNTDNLPAPLQRRFKSGKWFFDLPSDEQLEGIWCIHHASQHIDRILEIPQCNGWSGSDVASCCYMAASRGISLADAALRIVPYGTANPQELDGIRRAAAGRTIDAATGSLYHIPDGQKPVRYITKEE